MKGLVFTFAFLSVAPAFAQTASPAPEIDAEKAALEAESRIDEAMVTMTDLAEALSNHLGQLHYLRTLCFTSEDQKWRQAASDMMRVEAPGDSARRGQLIAAFNAGYYQQKERYSTCSPNVAIDVAALAENGRRLSVMLGDPYRER